MALLDEAYMLFAGINNRFVAVAGRTERLKG
jgi:hypothetical protein